MIYDVIIIGAGPAGLFAAQECSKNSLSTLVVEKNSSAGKKLLITGQGRCNITHTGTIEELMSGYLAGSKFLRPALKQWSNYDTIDFLEKYGPGSFISNDGRVYPKTQKASDVLNMLIGLCSKNGAEILYNTTICEIEKENNIYNISTLAEKIRSYNLIIATGGKSYPHTGSTGDGYKIAEKFGHTIVDPVPGLSSIIVSDFILSELSGMSFNNVQLTHYRENNKIGAYLGDILITHRGLSGPVILNYSRHMRKKDKLKINFLGVTHEELRSKLIKATVNRGNKTIKNSLKDVVNNIGARFIDKVFNIVNVNPDIKGAQLNKQNRESIISALTGMVFTIKRVDDFKTAMVTGGGIYTKEINRKTMESKLIEHLYFIGEVLDIDGKTGGYNLQASLSTAAAAAKAIISKKAKST